MQIAYIDGCSCVDWDGKICATVYTQGCNFRCEYCYNKRLWEVERGKISVDGAIMYLVSRSEFIDGVVITGGEPTIYGDRLIDFIKVLKDCGIPVKLDTNGSFPEMVEKAINIVDYIAMDVKYKIDEYGKVVGENVNCGRIKESMEIIVDSGIDYEFRTTVLSWFTVDDVVSIAEEVSSVGGERYVLQVERQNDRVVESAKRVAEGSYSKIKGMFVEVKKRW